MQTTVGVAVRYGIGVAVANYSWGGSCKWLLGWRLHTAAGVAVANASWGGGCKWKLEWRLQTGVRLEEATGVVAKG